MVTKIVTTYTGRQITLFEKEWTTWDNEVDALRHFLWNVYMTRQLGANVAQYAGDVHEYVPLLNKGWIEAGNAQRMQTKMNQATLMDLNNNAVGRDLASNTSLNDLSAHELFAYAKSINMLRLDAELVYEHYGIVSFLNPSDWTVNVIWGLETNRAIVLDPSENLVHIEALFGYGVKVK